MNWEIHAQGLAARISQPGSRWYQPVAATPRHLLVPRWWGNDPEGGEWGALYDGPSDVDAWMRATYSDQTLVTKVGPVHADNARTGERSSGLPTSSSTLPSLVVRMLRHLEVDDRSAVLDVATGSGYSAALLSHRLGDDLVTSVDVDPYLTEMATERLDRLGLRPKVITCDATGMLPGEYDRIVSMVSVRPIPAGWLASLRPGGRLVTVVSETSLIITATKTEDGGAVGRVEWDRARFMTTRSGADYPPRLDMFAEIRDRDGEQVTKGRYPMVNVSDAWDLWSMLEVIAPGIEQRYRESREDGSQTAWMTHVDGSWARASGKWDELPIVHQGGPRRLWDILDDIRHYWLRNGELPIRGARVSITPSGEITLDRAGWRGVIA